MRILLLGCKGQVGWELQRALTPLGDVVALGRDDSGDLCGDLARLDQLRETVHRVQPQAIVNAAAYTAVDRAESEPELADLVNGQAPGVLAEEAARLGACLVHYSTDYVFDGSGSTPWNEDDDPAPINVYGATKWRGEQAVSKAGCRHVILRTQWVYAARGNNFMRTMLRLAAERDALQVIDDQTGAPTGAELIADVTAHVLRVMLRQGAPSGTYHLAARGETTWYGYARFVIDGARNAKWPIRVADDAIRPVESAAFPTAARRPHNSRLAVDRLERRFDLRLPDWRIGVARTLAEIGGQAAANRGAA